MAKQSSIIEELVHETRYILKTARIDVAAFVALDKAERAARWCQWSNETRREFVQLFFIRNDVWLTEDEISEKVAALNIRCGLSADGLPRTEQAVVEALSELEEAARGAERAARTALAALDRNHFDYAFVAGNLKADAKFFARDANSYSKAREKYLAGIRPIDLGDRAWLLSSQRTDGTPHLLRFDGDWRCSCEAKDSMHWSKAMVIGLELAAELLDRDDDYHEPIAVEQPLGVRIAAARAKVEAAPSGSHDQAVAQCEERRLRGLDVCGRPEHAQNRPLRLAA